MNAQQLIDELLSAPRDFVEKGRAYELLQYYFRDFPVHTLRPLLASDDSDVHHAATFVASELGIKARSLVKDVVPLLHSEDRFVRFASLEVIQVGSDGDQVDFYVHVVRALTDPHQGLQTLVMGLVSNVPQAQLVAAARILAASDEDLSAIHCRGLALLTMGASATASQVGMLLDDPAPLARKYGAIAAYRLFARFPELLASALTSHDPAVRGFAEGRMERMSAEAGFLIEDLIRNPARFNERGRSNDLLHHYFHGFSLETLRPLLRHPDPGVQHAAIFVTSELGTKARSLLDDVIPLFRSEEGFVRYLALETIMVCSQGDRGDQFIHVIRALEDHDETIRDLAMFLVSNAAQDQLTAAVGILSESNELDPIHGPGLIVLAMEGRVNPERVRGLLTDSAPLARKYGAIAARRLCAKFPELLQLARASEDVAVVRFAEYVISFDSL